MTASRTDPSWRPRDSEAYATLQASLDEISYLASQDWEAYFAELQALAEAYDGTLPGDVLDAAIATSAVGCATHLAASTEAMRPSLELAFRRELDPYAFAFVAVDLYRWAEVRSPGDLPAALHVVVTARGRLAEIPDELRRENARRALEWTTSAAAAGRLD